MILRFSTARKVLKFDNGKVLAFKGQAKVLKLAPRGLPGEKGADGGAFYLHTQSIAGNIWTINHNLGFKPSVEILNAGGVEIEGEVTHISNNQTIINFTSALTGTARLN